MYLNKCLYNLKMIASIAPGQRMCTRDEYISQEPARMGNSVYRINDGRGKMLARVSDIVRATIEIADRIMESQWLEIKNEPSIDASRMRTQRVSELKLIWERLGEAKHGIDGQNQTYPGDATIGHPLQVLLTEIDEARTRIRIRLQACGETVY